MFNRLELLIVGTLMIAMTVGLLWGVANLFVVVYQLSSFYFSPLAAAIITECAVLMAYKLLASDTSANRKKCPHCKEKQLVAYHWPSPRYSRSSLAYYLCTKCGRRLSWVTDINAAPLFKSRWQDASASENDHFYNQGTLADQRFRTRLLLENANQKAADEKAEKRNETSCRR